MIHVLEFACSRVRVVLDTHVFFPILITRLDFDDQWNCFFFGCRPFLLAGPGGFIG